MDNSSFNFEGKVIKLFPPREYGNFKTQDFIAEETADSQWKRHIKFSIINDKIEVQEGRSYKFSFNINANESKKNPGVWFNSLDCWSAKPLEITGSGTSHQPTMKPQVNNNLPEDDLPF